MPRFNFTLDSFQITNTRALHDDTDYLSFTLKVGLGAPQTLVKSMGSINNGNHFVRLSFNNVDLALTTPICLNYLIANAGQVTRVQAETVLEAAGAVFANGIGLEDTNPANFESSLQYEFDWLAGQLGGIYQSNCDGTVAAERDVFVIDDLIAKDGGIPFHQSTLHEGTDSALGCGSNSSYVVNWHVAYSAIAPEVEGLKLAVAEARIRAAGLVPAVSGSGSLVANQTPTGGAVLDLGAPVSIHLGNITS